MSIIKQYGYKANGNLQYIMFFCTEDRQNPYVDAITVARSEDLGETPWWVWVTQAHIDEIDDVCLDPANPEPKYDTEGYSETFYGLDELLDSLRGAGYPEIGRIEREAYDFFG